MSSVHSLSLSDFILEPEELESKFPFYKRDFLEPAEKAGVSVHTLALPKAHKMVKEYEQIEKMLPFLQEVTFEL